MMHAHVNYLAVVVAALAAMMVGFVWYSQALFGRMWIKIIGKENLSQVEQEQMKKDTGPYFGVMFAGTLIGAFVFALFIRWLHAYTAVEGMQIAFWAWLGFIFPVVLGAALFSGKDKDLVWLLFLIQAGHSLAGMLVMGAILGMWR